MIPELELSWISACPRELDVVNSILLDLLPGQKAAASSAKYFHNSRTP